MSQHNGAFSLHAAILEECHDGRPKRPNRPLSYSQYDRSRLSDDRFSGWGLPVLIGAIVLVGGLLLFGVGPTNRTTTAHNDRAPVTTNVPAQTPAPMPPAGAQK